MLVNKVVLSKEAATSRKMENLIDIANDQEKTSELKQMFWQPDMVSYVGETWRKLNYTHQGLFGKDNHEKDKKMYYGVSGDDTKYITMVTDMAIASSMLYSTGIRPASYLRDLIPSSEFGKTIWDNTLFNISVKSDDETEMDLSGLFAMGYLDDPLKTEHPEDDDVLDTNDASTETTMDESDVIDGVFEEIIEPAGNVIYLGTTEGTPEDPLNGKPVETKVENKKPVVEKKQETKTPEVKTENTNKSQNPAKNQNKPQNNNSTPKANVEKAETPGDIKIQEPEPVAISFGEALSSLVTFEDGTKQDLIQENVVPFQKSTADKKNNNRYIKMYPELKQFVEMTDELKLVVKFSESNVKAYVHDDYRLITAQIYDPSVARSNMPYVATLFIDPNEIYNNGFNVLSSNRGNGNIFEEDCVKLTDKQNVLEMICGGLSEDARVMARNKMNTYAKSVIQIVDFRPALSDNKKVLPEKTYQLLLPAVWAICEKTKALYGILNSVENEKKFSMVVAVDDNATGTPTEYSIDFDPEKYKGNTYKMTKVTDEEPVVVDEKKEPTKTQDKKPHTKEEAKAAIRKASANGTLVRIVDSKQSNAQKSENQNK